MSLADSAVPLVEAAQKRPVSRLYYGPGGSGKTLLATKHPGKRKLWLDVDEKLHELLEMITPEERSSITVWTPGEVLAASQIQIARVDPQRKNIYATGPGNLIQERPKGYQKIVDVTNELLKLGYAAKKGEAEFPYDLIVADSASRISDHLIPLIMYEHKVSSMNQTLYDVFKRNFKDWLAGFLNLPCDRILIAHDHIWERVDKDTNEVVETRIRPGIVGTMRDELVTYFTEVYYFKGRGFDKKYKIQTFTSRDTVARTGHKNLADEQILDDPTIIYKS